MTSRFNSSIMVDSSSNGSMMTKQIQAPTLQTKDKDDLQAIVQTLVKQAMDKGASGVEVSASTSVGYCIETRLGEVDKLEYTNDKGLGLTVYFDQQKGSAGSSDLSLDALNQVVEKACSIARHTGVDPCSGLPDPDRLAFNYPDCDLNYPWQLTPQQAIAMAIEGEKHGMAQDPRITNSEGVSVDTSQGFRVFANSAGFVGAYPASNHSLSCVLLATDPNGQMERDYSYTCARDPAELLPVNQIAAEAAEKTVARLGARRVKTGNYPVIFQAQAARGLLGHLIGAIQGSRIYRQSSYLVDKLNQPVISKQITLHEDPHEIKGLGSAPFDSEGVATQARDLVNEGILQTYCLGSYSARKLGLQTTGHAGGVRNVSVQTPNTLDFDALLNEMHQGLLITDVMGQGINLVTGDYSRGAAGFWIENGKIDYPVSEITLAGNLNDMFHQIAAVGNDVDKRGNIATGSLLISSMAVAGD